MKNLYKRFLAAAVIVVLSTAMSAQESAIRYNPEQEFNHAMELFEKEKYAEAQHLFDEIQKSMNDDNGELSVEAEYHAALCAMNLYHKDTRFRMTTFIEDHSESPKVRTAYFDLGAYYYRRKKYKTAIEWFEKVNLYDLNAQQTTEYYFQSGYCYFRKSKFTEAKHAFKNLTTEQNKYYAPANYYYSHINYEEGNYETALKGFEALQTDENFGPLVPLYIVQINFRQERYVEVTKFAEESLSEESYMKKPELSRMVGESYFKLDQYDAALPFLDKYHASSSQKTRDDHYVYGFALYRAGQFQKAIPRFSAASNEDDEMTQMSTYLMADCHLKLDERKYAKTAFKKASEYTFDPEIQEDALFNYAKISYELSVNPFHEAIIAFEKYLKEYPGSARRDEAWEFLLNVYLTTNNYEAGLEALAKIQDKNFKIKSAYQHCAYNRGVELFLNRKLDEAQSVFVKVETYPIDPQLNAQAKYWMAEIHYLQEKYPESIASYITFKKEPGAFDLPEYNHSNYGLAYAHFKQKNYAEAKKSFSTYLKSPGINKKKKDDATLRMADCIFVEKKYDQAIATYKKAKDAKASDSDYALYQMSLCSGYSDNPVAKVNYLEELLSSHSKSTFVPAAKFGIGDANFTMNNPEKAYAYFQKVIDDHPSSLYVKGAFLKKGLIEYRRKEYEAAVGTFKQLIKNYPEDQVSAEAKLRIQDVYVELGRMNEFNEWYEENMPTGSVAAQDSINYRAAEKLYTGDSFNQAQGAFEAYLAKFQPGIFGVHAHYYLGECLYEIDNKDDALTHYLYVVDQPINLFSESALLSAASINYESKEYEGAINNYIDLEKIAAYDINVLEARIGLMRSYFFTGEYDKALTYADAVIGDDKTPDQIGVEAHLFKGKILFTNDNLDKALMSFEKVTKLSEGKLGAEAKYRIAYIYFVQEKFEQAESEVFDHLQTYSAYEYWKVKAFVLLADIYVGMENYFQAKSTLQSIIDNVDDLAVKQQAETKLAEVIAMEEAKNNPEPILDEDEDEDELYEE
ncbi:MAG: tetratricopeptide (TPR) repeat protein [Urechidicola sp.]|jgi:tetratricopeptide (TPR) repeat protein